MEALEGSAYEAALRKGLERHGLTGRLSAFERALNRYRLHGVFRLIGRDPLDIGVVLGYLALKTAEVSNIRWIAQGISLGMAAEAIRADRKGRKRNTVQDR